MMGKIKLHLGCGKRDFGDDWVHIDGGDFPHLHSHDITKLPFNENSVHLIYASHVLEYFDFDQSIELLDEWYRVLRYGGVLRLAVPDFEAMTRLYISGEYGLDSFLGPLYGRMYMGEATIYHKMCYDFEMLKASLEYSNFKDVRRYDWRETEHAQFDDHSQAYLPHMKKETGTLISLNIEANK